MNYTQEADSDLVVLRLSGQLMGGPDAEALRETIRTSLDRGIRNIILDMCDITWVNSAGLGILIASHLAARQSGGSLRFVNLSKRIASILSVTRLSTVFDIFPTEDEARNHPAPSATERSLR
jgi:anti-sigma B factor antagonist